MPELKEQKDFRAIQKLAFCYSCGKDFLPSDKANRDHIPPRSCFAAQDKHFPLVLPTHSICNHVYGDLDEKIGQVISLKHSGLPSQPRNLKIKFERVKIELTGSDPIGVNNVDISGAIWRWIRGFHAALYREYLPADTWHELETPFPKAQIGSSDTKLMQLNEAHHRNRVKLIMEFRVTKTVDRITCNNEKLLYECAWVQDENNRWICMFALNLYDWKDLGDIKNFPARGCVGVYSLQSGMLPNSATKGLRPDIILPNIYPLDPFGR